MGGGTVEILTLALGFACLAYGIAIFRPREESSCHVPWIAAGAVLGGTSGACMIWPRVAVMQLLTSLLGGAAVIGACAIAAASVLILAAAKDAPPANLSYLVVLGAHVHQNGTPSRALRQRLETARAYLVENPSAVAVVSGGQGADETCTEASAMARWLIAHGIEAERILGEDKSTTTAENIRYALDLLDANEPVGLVTNDFHIWRALRIARRQGLRNACGIPAPSTRLYLPNNLARECFATVKNMLAGTM